MDTIRRRIQTDGFVPGTKGKLRYTGVMTTARIIIAQEGWRGFFKGVSVNWMRVRLSFHPSWLCERLVSQYLTACACLFLYSTEPIGDRYQSHNVRYSQGSHGCRENSLTSAISIELTQPTNSHLATTQGNSSQSSCCLGVSAVQSARGRSGRSRRSCLRRPAAPASPLPLCLKQLENSV